MGPVTLQRHAAHLFNHPDQGVEVEQKFELLWVGGSREEDGAQEHQHRDQDVDHLDGVSDINAKG